MVEFDYWTSRAFSAQRTDYLYAPINNDALQQALVPRFVCDHRSHRHHTYAHH